MKKVMLVFGTRPEAIKMCPLVKELKRRENLQTVVCVTGQHRQMLDQVLEIFDVQPDYDLSVMQEKQTLFDITANILLRIREVLEKERPDVCLVHGDTSTTFVTALACFYLQIPVGHVEAGLRTYDIYSPYPEEFNRQAVSILSAYNFAPTQRSKDNLLREGKKPETIWVTGNTAIDALKTTVREDYTHPELDWAKDSRLIFITAHRRENLGEPMHHMFRAIRRVMEDHPDVKALYPIHMNPVVRKAAEEELSSFLSGVLSGALSGLSLLEFSGFAGFGSDVFKSVTSGAASSEPVSSEPAASGSDASVSSSSDSGAGGTYALPSFLRCAASSATALSVSAMASSSSFLRSASEITSSAWSRASFRSSDMISSEIPVLFLRLLSSCISGISFPDLFRYISVC